MCCLDRGVDALQFGSKFRFCKQSKLRHRFIQHSISQLNGNGRENRRYPTRYPNG